MKFIIRFIVYTTVTVNYSKINVRPIKKLTIMKEKQNNPKTRQNKFRNFKTVHVTPITHFLGVKSVALETTETVQIFASKSVKMFIDFNVIKYIVIFTKSSFFIENLRISDKLWML